MGGVVDCPDRRLAEQVPSGSRQLQTLFQVRAGFVLVQRLHEDGGGDRVCQGFQDGQFEPCHQVVLSAQQDAQTGLAVVLEVQKLAQLDQDVIGQAVCFVD